MENKPEKTKKEKSKPVDQQPESGKQPDGKFGDFIRRMCESHNWKTREFDDEHAVIEFTVDQQRSQTLFIFCYEDDLEFSVPSFAAFDSMEKVPHYISTSLLQINAKTKIGFWCVESIGGKMVYSYMHNALMSQTGESMFKDIIMTLVQRVDDFENLLIKMSEQGKAGEEPAQ